MSKLTDIQKSKLSEAFRSAFRTAEALDNRVLFFKLGLTFEKLELNVDDPLHALYPALIDIANEDGWIADLIEAAVKENPTNIDLGAFYREWKRVEQLVDQQS